MKILQNLWGKMNSEKDGQFLVILHTSADSAINSYAGIPSYNITAQQGSTAAASQCLVARCIGNYS